jgi:glycosyltransferase involved in cell wall biosynthesis
MSMRITANDYPESKNRIRRALRWFFSQAAFLGLIARPTRPQGISVTMRVKDEEDWIVPSIRSISALADQIVVVDNGSTDRTYEIVRELAEQQKDLVQLWREPDLDYCDLCNFSLSKTRFRWVMKWDGDMVAHTSGARNISSLRDRLLSLDPRGYFAIYLRHVNLSGDLWHQDPREMLHTEPYLHTFSEKTKYVRTETYEAIKFPKFYHVLFWYDPYSFHVSVKPIEQLLLRQFWNQWLANREYERYTSLESYAKEKAPEILGVSSWDDAREKFASQAFRNHIRFDPELFGPHPELLKPFLENPKYQLRYENGKVTGREER